MSIKPATTLMDLERQFSPRDVTIDSQDLPSNDIRSLVHASQLRGNQIGGCLVLDQKRGLSAVTRDQGHSRSFGIDTGIEAKLDRYVRTRHDLVGFG